MPADYDIRRARPADLDAILAFQRAAIARVSAGFYSAPTQVVWLRVPTPGLADLVAAGRYVVADENGRPIGGAGWRPGMPDGAAAALRGVFVHPARKACGLGTRLVRAAEDAAMRAGYAPLFVPAALNAVGFYERLGYSEDGVGAFELDGIALPYCKMWKRAASIVAARHSA